MPSEELICGEDPHTLTCADYGDVLLGTSCFRMAKNILERHLPDIKRLLILESVSTYLISAGCMTQEQRRQLETTPHKGTVACDLVELINKGGQKSQKAFFTALEVSADEDNQPGHKELLDILQKSRKRKESDTTGQPRSPNISPETSYTDVNDAVFTDSIVQPTILNTMLEPEPPPITGTVDTSLNESHVELIGLQTQNAATQIRDPQTEEEDTTNTRRPSIGRKYKNPFTQRPIPPPSWKPFLVGMLCSALLAAGTALIVFSIDGFVHEEDCDLGARFSISTFDFLAGFLCLTLPVVLILLILEQMCREYDCFPVTRKCLICISSLYLGFCVVVGFGQLGFSFYISIYTYGQFDDVLENKVNCTDALFFSSFVSLTAFYLFILGILVFLVLLYIHCIRRRYIMEYTFPFFARASD